MIHIFDEKKSAQIRLKLAPIARRTSRVGQIWSQIVFLIFWKIQYPDSRYFQLRFSSQNLDVSFELEIIHLLESQGLSTDRAYIHVPVEHAHSLYIRRERDMAKHLVLGALDIHLQDVVEHAIQSFLFGSKIHILLLSLEKGPTQLGPKDKTTSPCSWPSSTCTSASSGGSGGGAAKSSSVEI